MHASVGVASEVTANGVCPGARDPGNGLPGVGGKCDGGAAALLCSTSIAYLLVGWGFDRLKVGWSGLFSTFTLFAACVLIGVFVPATRGGDGGVFRRWLS